MSFHDRGFGRKNAGARLDDAKEMNELVAALKERDAEITAFATKAAAEIKANGQIATETKNALDKLSKDGAGLADRLMAVEQKLSKRGGIGEQTKSLAEQLAETGDFKAMAAKTGPGVARIKAATITSATTDAAGSAGSLIAPDRLAGIIAAPDRELTIRDLLLPGNTSSNAIEYQREVGFTNGAATVAEGAPRGTSDLQFEDDVANVRTISHLFTVSDQVLSDVPLLQSYVATRATYGLRFEEEEQIVAGDGNGSNLLGLIPQATPFAESSYSDLAHDTRIDTVRRGILQARLAQYRPTFIVLNPISWAAIELTRDDAGRYIEVSIREGGQMRLWRLNVVETTAIESDHFLIGATQSAQVFDRQDVTIELSNSHNDNFSKGLVSIRATERLALAVYRPESFIYGQFDLGNIGTSPGSLNV